MVLKQLKNASDVKKYIKRVFGMDIDVKIKHHFWGGYEGTAYIQDNRLEIAKKAFQDQSFLRILIWHEIGHFRTKWSSSRIQRESDADVWAARYARKKGYTTMYHAIVDRAKHERDVLGCDPDWFKAKNGFASPRTYQKAAMLTIQRLGIVT